jgi:hypothetical protein
MTSVDLAGASSTPEWTERLCQIPTRFREGGASVRDLSVSAATDKRGRIETPRESFTLRPTWSAVAEIVARGTPIAGLGAAGIAVGLWSGRVFALVAGLVGVLFGAFFIAYKLSACVRLRNGVLSYHSLLETHKIGFIDVTEVVPVELTLTYGFLWRRRTTGHFFDVRSANGSGGFG